MGTVINTNMASLIAQRALKKNDDAMETSMKRLSTGLRINSARDDAAGLAIATRMDTQIKGSTVAIRNANDGVSMAQVTEGAIGELTGILQRMRELTVQAANTGAVSLGDKAKLQDEFANMGSELKRTIDNTSYNGLKVLAGGASKRNFQIGANDDATNQISITISNANLMASGTFRMSKLFNAGATTMKLSAGLVSAVKFGSILKTIDMALERINDSRAKIGAVQNRFMVAISNLSQSIENTSAAKSRLMDTDFAAETSNLSRNQILQQAATAMLSQGNQSTQGVMSLLR